MPNSIRWCNLSKANPKLLLVINELIIVLGRSIIGKTVTLLKINYLQLQVVHTLRCYNTIQMNEWLSSYKLTAVCFSMFLNYWRNISKFSSHKSAPNLKNVFSLSSILCTCLRYLRPIRGNATLNGPITLRRLVVISFKTEHVGAWVYSWNDVTHCFASRYFSENSNAKHFVTSFKE